MVNIINLNAPIYCEMEDILRLFLSLEYERAAEQFVRFEREYGYHVDLPILAGFYGVLQRVIQGSLNLGDQIHKDPFRLRSTWISRVNNNFKRRIRKTQCFFSIELIDRFKLLIDASTLSPSMRIASLVGGRLFVISLRRLCFCLSMDCL
jgi:hypothetical protein